MIMIRGILISSEKIFLASTNPLGFVQLHSNFLPIIRNFPWSRFRSPAI